MISKCPVCGRWRVVERRRLPTAFVDDERNFQQSCVECYEETRDFYLDAWAEHHSNCL
jgi:hypothetical protein